MIEHPPCGIPANFGPAILYPWAMGSTFTSYASCGSKTIGELVQERTAHTGAGTLVCASGLGPLADPQLLWETAAFVWGMEWLISGGAEAIRLGDTVKNTLASAVHHHQNAAMRNLHR
jgi:hypothetical protein